ncbi:BRO1-like domain-containing protein [Entophlyctis helioformis]|nr:BRO1-like domain-containing protein [Entophlyctis helioformis]
MASSLQTPLLHVPSKRTEEVDFSAPFRQYILSAYQEEPDKYAGPIAQLNRFRQDMRGAGKDLTGRDVLYRYYGQLELLDLRFPIEERAVKVMFNWYDAFTSKPIAQYSIAYEKASVIFNIGATCSSIGALQNRFDISGLKVAFNYFQAAAGLFQYINDNFLHAPSVDMSRDSIKCLVDLMLGQAQECFIEKVVIEKKRGAIVAKLAAQVAFTYAGVVDGFGTSSLRGQFDKSWVDLVKIKAKYFQTLAYYHRSIQMETENKYGELVSYANAADAAAKDVVKLATSFASMFPTFTVSSEAAGSISPSTPSATGQKTSDAAALSEMAKSLAKLAADRKQVALKDNELIYHASVPEVEALPPIEKLNAVKTIPFADLCTNGQADITQIIGPDIFLALVPLGVHEAASMYSEEKATVLRAEQGRVRAADGELQATFDSLNMIPTLDRLKRLLRSSDASPLSATASSPGSATYGGGGALQSMPLPEEIVNVAVTVASEEQDRTKIEYLASMVDGLKPKIRGVLDEVTLLLDKEQHDCENLRVKYMDQWTMEPSFKLTTGMRTDIRTQRESLEKAGETDKGVQHRAKELKPFLALFTRPLADVETHFAETIYRSAPLSRREDRRMSLLDENVDAATSSSRASGRTSVASNGSASGDGLGVLGEQIVIEKIDGILGRLRSLKHERSELVEELKRSLHDDDISSLLLLNKGREKQIFQSELSKFRPLQGKLDSNLEAHTILLQDVTAEFNKLVASSHGMRVLDTRERKRAELVRDWLRSFDVYRDVKAGYAKGVSFYTDLAALAETLRTRVVEFVNRRNAERGELVQRIDTTHAERGQQALREQLQKLSMASSPASSPAGTAPPAVSHAAGTPVAGAFPMAPAPASQQPSYAQSPVQYQPQQVHVNGAAAYQQPPPQQPVHQQPVHQQQQAYPYASQAPPQAQQAQQAYSGYASQPPVQQYQPQPPVQQQQQQYQPPPLPQQPAQPYQYQQPPLPPQQQYRPQPAPQPQPPYPYQQPQPLQPQLPPPLEPPKLPPPVSLPLHKPALPAYSTPAPQPQLQPPQPPSVAYRAPPPLPPPATGSGGPYAYASPLPPMSPPQHQPPSTYGYAPPQQPQPQQPVYQQPPQPYGYAPQQPQPPQQPQQQYVYGAQPPPPPQQQQGYPPQQHGYTYGQPLQPQPLQPQQQQQQPYQPYNTSSLLD